MHKLVVTVAEMGIINAFNLFPFSYPSVYSIVDGNVGMTAVVSVVLRIIPKPTQLPANISVNCVLAVSLHNVRVLY